MPQTFGRCMILMIALAMMGFSCHRDNREEIFELNHHIDFDIQPGLNTFETHIYQVGPLTSLLESKLAAAGRSRDEVTAVEPKRAYLSGIFEDTNLDFIHQVSVLIYDPFNPSDKIEFYYLDPVPFRDKVGINLFPGITDITEWIDREYFAIEVRLNYRQVSPSFIQMRLQFDMQVMGD